MGVANQKSLRILFLIALQPNIVNPEFASNGASRWNSPYSELE
jgi:hypothetical protein